MAIFGYDTIGSISAQDNGIYNYATLFTCPDNCTITQISVALTPNAITDKLKVAIFDTSKNLITSGELNPLGSTDKKFYNVTVVPANLTKNTQYYLASAASDLNGATTGSIWIARDGVDETWIYSNMATDTAYALLWENTWTNDGGGTGRKFSIYATYETSTSTTSTSSSTTSTSSSTTSTSSSTTSTSSSTTSTSTTTTSTSVPYLKFSVSKVELPLEQNDEVLQLNVKLVK